MKRLFSLPALNWDSTIASEQRLAALRALEQGQVLYFPSLGFPIAASETRFLDPAILTRSKNVSYNPATKALGGTVCRGADAEALQALMQRFADAAHNLLQKLVTYYGSDLQRERTSLRPATIEGRVTSWRKDDRRLHVDSFPSQPTQGWRILRLFCNVNPENRPRTWRVGEPFPAVVQHFWPHLEAPPALQRQILSWLHITKGFRTDYDHYMLQLHDAMKADTVYQEKASQEVIDFPAGSAWACFTDQVSHAAMAGQHQLEQTFTLPIEAMRNQNTAPLTVLEQRAGRSMVAHTWRKAA